MRLFLMVALVVVLAGLPLQAQVPESECDASRDALLSRLAIWSMSCDSAFDLSFAAAVTGAGLTVAYDANSGFVVDPRQRLRWPGNLFLSLDSSYVLRVPQSWREAESLLVHTAAPQTPQLILSPDPTIVTGVDTSLGAPWFFIARCDSGQATALIWDRSDFRRLWWRWADLPGANSIWPLPPGKKFKIGRQIVYAAIRNLVLAARPDSLGSRHFGLSALTAGQSHLDTPPGSADDLRRFAELRRDVATFLGRVVDLWPPAKREPVRLAAFYFQKDAEAWQTVAAASETWAKYDKAQLAEWLASIAEWETKAAVALDGMLSESR